MSNVMIRASEVLHTERVLEGILCRKPDPEFATRGAVTFQQLTERMGMSWKELGQMLMEGQLSHATIIAAIEMKEDGGSWDDDEDELMDVDVPDEYKVDDGEDMPF